MGFIGSINDKLRKFFYTHAGVLEGRDVFIGCSGNFTVEQIISRRCKNAIIHSNDVSMYTSVLGHHITGQRLPLIVINEELLWMQQYINQGGDYAAACLSLALSMFKFEKRNNTFAERMWQTYLINFESMLEKTVEKVRKAVEHIRCDEYTMIDVHDYYPQPDGVSIGFLPTYVGGYEKLFQRLDESIQWDKPAYDMLTTERREATIEKMAQGDYILYDDRERDMPVVARVDLPGKPNGRAFQYNRKALEAWLPTLSKLYWYKGDVLGGFKPIEPDALQWLEGLNHTMGIKTNTADTGPIRFNYLVMCFEANPRECHRHYILARHLVSKGIEVIHLDKEMRETPASALSSQPSLL